MRLQVDRLGKVAITVEQGYWDINKDYDKLTVVQVKGKFATYISRKPVPRGTVLTDRVYWIPFSSLKEDILIDYNKFINTYNEYLKDLSDKVTNIENDIALIKYLRPILERLEDIEERLMSLEPMTNEEIDAITTSNN